MNKKQIEIGDKLLELFVENNGQLYEIEFKRQLKSYGYNVTLITTTANSMIEDYGLLRRSVYNNDAKMITAEGRRAYKIGIEKFIKEFEEIKELEKENLKANIKTAKIAEKNAKYSLTISIIALIMAAIIPILAVVKVFI